MRVFVFSLRFPAILLTWVELSPSLEFLSKNFDQT